MANFLYPNAKRLMLTGQFDWTSDDVVAVLVATGQYVPSINHISLLDVPASARVAVSGVLTGKAVATNVVDADDCLFSAVSGPPCSSVLLVAMGDTDATSWLICHLDDAISGLPLTPTASPVQLAWSDGADKIFAL